jgi:O-antigen/teichoic acid export membrane protein
LLIGLVVTILLARSLGPAEYGRLALVTASVGAVKQVVDVRTWEAVTRYLAAFTEEGRPDLGLATLKLAVAAEALVGIVAWGTAVAGSGLVARRLLGDPGLAGLIALYATTLLTTAFNGTAKAVLRVFGGFAMLAAQGALAAALWLGAIAVAVGLDGRVHGVLAATLASDAVAAGLLAMLAWREVGLRLGASPRGASITALRPHLPEMARFVGHTSLRATLKLSRQLDLLALGHFRPAAEVGYYRLARQMALAFEAAGDPLYFAIFPELARTWTRARGEMGRMIARAAAVGAGLAIPGFLFCLTLAPVVVLAWVGPGYAPAVAPFRMLALGVALSTVTFWGTPAALGSGHPGIATSANALGVLSTAWLLLLLVPGHGPLGAALAVAAGALVASVTVSLLLGRALRLAVAAS